MIVTTDALSFVMYYLKWNTVMKRLRLRYFTVTYY